MRTSTVVIIGTRGSGKTHLAKTEILPRSHPLIVYDVNAEFENYPGLSAPENDYDFMDLLEINESILIRKDSMGFESLCFTLNEVQEPYTLVVDEFHTLYNNHNSFKADCPSFEPLFLLGNHNNVSMVILSQRAANLPKYVISQCTELNVFYLWNKADLEFLGQAVDNPYQFKELNKYHYKRIKFETPISIEEHQTKNI